MRSTETYQVDRNGFIRCRICGCTNDEPCNPPCGWAKPGLCTTCAAAAEAVTQWMMAVPKTNFSGLLREAKARYQEGCD